jgi:hypothetical protein
MVARRAAASLLAALACAAFPPCGLADALAVPVQGATIPMLDFGGRPVVEVTINGKGPFRLVADTGAAETVLDSSLAAELSLRDTDVQLDEMRIGPIVFRELRAFVAPLSGLLRGEAAPRGVLSASVFPRHLLTFDFPRRHLLVRAGALPEAQGRTVFSYAGADLPSIPVRVAGREITVHLDTGAPYALALPTRYMKELPLSGEPVQRGTARTHAGSSAIYVASVAGEIAIGDFTLPTRELRFTDVVPDRHAAPKGQLGSEALRDFVVTLDAGNKRVRMERAP